MTGKWPVVSLGELLRLERRRVEVLAGAQYQEIGIYCFGRGIFHKVPRSGLEVGDKDLFLMKEGDFILQVTFAWEGAVAIVSALEDGMYGSSRYPTFRVDESRCLPQFLLHYIKTRQGLQQLIKICPGSAGRNRVLSIKRIPEVLVPLPPVAQQLRVVAQLEELSAEIHEARTLRSQSALETEALTKSTFNYELTKATRKYGVQRMAEVAKCAAGFGFPKAHQGRKGLKYPFAKVSDMNLPENERAITTANNWVDDDDVRQLRLKIYPIGTIIFPKIGGAIATNKRRVLALPATFDNNVMGLIPSEKLLGEFLLAFMQSFNLTELQAGTSVPAISQAKVEDMKIPVPPLPEQRRIVAELGALQAEADALKRLQAETAAELDALLPALLDRAFHGEL